MESLEQTGRVTEERDLKKPPGTEGGRTVTQAADLSRINLALPVV
jgi:hypothetical protein